jgi:hypothetical protein
MKAIVKNFGAILIFLVLLLVTLRATGFEPKDCPPGDRDLPCRVPGLWLRGDVVTTPVTDWSFTDKIPQIKIQTQTRFLLPHSVTIWCAVYNGSLYLTSSRGREWVEDAVRDPHVRLKIGDQIYEGSLSLIDDSNEKGAVLQAKGKKYPQWKVTPVARAAVFRLLPG